MVTAYTVTEKPPAAVKEFPPNMRICVRNTCEALEEWAGHERVRVVQCVDPGGETPEWKGQIGFVAAVLETAAPKPENTVAVMCGPPVMIKFSLNSLSKLGFSDDNVYTTPENKMKCGVGKCGRCNVGDVYICKEGPVYTAAEVKKMYNDF